MASGGENLGKSGGGGDEELTPKGPPLWMQARERHQKKVLSSSGKLDPAGEELRAKLNLIAGGKNV